MDFSLSRQKFIVTRVLTLYSTEQLKEVLKLVTYLRMQNLVSAEIQSLHPLILFVTKVKGTCWSARLVVTVLE